MKNNEQMSEAWKSIATKPDYYKRDGKDLFDRFEDGLMSNTETKGFYKANIIKYITRYQNKNGIEDLEKAETYLDRLIIFERKLSHDTV